MRRSVGRCYALRGFSGASTVSYSSTQPVLLRPRLSGLLFPATSRAYATKVPADLKYSKSHEWIRLEGNIGTIGITDHAQDALGEVVYVDLPSVGAVYGAKDVFGAVESVKTVSDLYTPVAGEVVQVNENLKDEKQASLLNTDPYGKGWLIKIKVSDPSGLNDLLDNKGYKTLCEQEAH
jgi:glycine cleavage system H protein